MTAARQGDPSRVAGYVDDEFYRTLVANFSDWQRDEREVGNPAIRDRLQALLYREARLLDQGQFEAWLDLYTLECLYWVPATPRGGDPRTEVAIAFDDRRRLEDRIYRLRTGYAWAQVPPSRTARLVSNVEVFGTEQRSVYMVRSTFVVNEFRAGETRRLAGWCGHRVAQQDDRWQILVKQVNLIDCDQNLRNPSVIF
ncbi:MAG: aromatic-ring-hydroxylating dioxygenase subunit beta [Actinobacteria bacterium]|nr:aromatic-ring-hydroxylating dioxygenase subunit beta [Actinomycetota bacterium]